MAHIYDLHNINLLRPSVITIGVFDGVHLGHQHLIHKLVDEAHDADCLAVAMTFFPHPDVVIHSIDTPYSLTTAQERANLLLNLGLDYVVTHPFDNKIRQIRAGDFVDQLLTHLKVTRLWVGDDFALGYKREGNVDFLRKAGNDKGFSVEVVDMLETERNGRVSSTLIREALRSSDVEKARNLLGRSYSVAGKVIYGQARGRTIGYPTANIDVWDQQIIPANGVYAGWAYLGSERFMAMTNVGVSPTFAYKGITVESYLLDFDRDIYGENLKVTFEKYLRPEQEFDGVKALIVQIEQDVQQGRQYLSSIDI